MKKEGKKSKSYTKEIIIGVVLLLVIILCVIFLISNNGGSKKNNENKTNDVDKALKDQEHKLVEKDIVDAYGMSSDDAIERVKTIFNSDNFEFKADINEDAKYVVTVKNTISSTTYKYLVDPVSGSFTEMN
jgi:ABC-type Na+ efflux pump permease subunit